MDKAAIFYTIDKVQVSALFLGVLSGVIGSIFTALLLSAYNRIFRASPYLRIRVKPGPGGLSSVTHGQRTKHWDDKLLVNNTHSNIAFHTNLFQNPKSVRNYLHLIGFTYTNEPIINTNLTAQGSLRQEETFIADEQKGNRPNENVKRKPINLLAICENGSGRNYCFHYNAKKNKSKRIYWPHSYFLKKKYSKVLK